jgi:hypothetical protein
VVRLQAADLGGLRDLAQLREGGLASTAQLGRQLTYFGYRAAKRRSAPHLRYRVHPPPTS